MRALRIQGLEAAVAKLKEDPDHPVLAEVDGLVIEMRYRGRPAVSEGGALFEAINRAYRDDSPDPEEAARRRAMRDKQRRLVTGEW
jgi:hypothetical protein